MTTPLNKTAISVLDMINKIKGRGILCDDVYLKNLFTFINYYRFLPYIKHQLKHYSNSQPIDFSQIENCYKFDKKLRGLLSESTESVENFIRNDLTEYFRSKNQHFYTDFLKSNYLHIPSDQNTLLKDIEKTFQKTPNDGVNHYKKKYSCTIDTIPLWVLVEALDFGQSIWFVKEINKYDQTGFRTYIHIKYNILPSEYLTCANSTRDLRNVCAHGNRLYLNTLNGHKPKFPSSWNFINPQGNPLTTENTLGLYRKLLGIMFFYKNRPDAWFDFIENIHQHFENNKGIISYADYYMTSEWQDSLMSNL